MFTLTRVLKSHIETRHLARLPAQATVQDTTWGLAQELQSSLVKALAVKRHQHGGRNGPGFGQSSSEHRGKQRTGFGFSEDVNFREWSSSKDNGGKRRTGVKFSTVHSSDEEESDLESSFYKHG